MLHCPITTSKHFNNKFRIFTFSLYEFKHFRALSMMSINEFCFLTVKLTFGFFPSTRSSPLSSWEEAEMCFFLPPSILLSHPQHRARYSSINTSTFIYFPPECNRGGGSNNIVNAYKLLLGKDYEDTEIILLCKSNSNNSRKQAQTIDVACVM